MEVFLLQSQNAIRLSLGFLLYGAHLVHILVVEELQICTLMLQLTQTRLQVCRVGKYQKIIGELAVLKTQWDGDIVSVGSIYNSLHIKMGVLKISCKYSLKLLSLDEKEIPNKLGCF